MPHATAAVAVALGLDVVAAIQVQPSLPQDDPVHLQTAAEDARIMVTYNRDDFLHATMEAFTLGQPHAGLLILTRRLPRDPVRIAHTLATWGASRQAASAWPMQPYEVDFA